MHNALLMRMVQRISDRLDLTVEQKQKLDAVKDYDCPTCGATMLHDRDDNQKHVTYETCPNGHGSYLDAGELTDLMKKTFWDKFKRPG